MRARPQARGSIAACAAARARIATAALALAMLSLPPGPAGADETTVWDFISPEGYLFDPSRIDVANGEALLRRDAAWPDPERPCLRPVTIPAPACAPACGLVPVRLRLDETNFDFEKAAPDGHDLLFMNAAGAAVSHWVESFDPAQRKALVTVALPAFAPPASEMIRVLYGDTACTATGSWESTFLDGLQELPVGSITSGQSFDAFPALERMPDGDLLVAYRTGSGHSSGDGALRLARSSDEGESWTTQPLYDDPFRDDRVDLGLKRLSDGTLLLPFFKSYGSAPTGCFIMRSTDGGVQWSAPYELPEVLTSWMAVYGQIVELPDGTLLLPAYGEQRWVEDGRTVILQSADAGQTWSLRSFITSPGVSFTEASIIPLDGSELLMIVRDGEWESMLYECRSHDLGLTWDEPEPLFLGASPSLLRLSNGHLLLGSSDRAGITGVRLSISTDDGATWAAAVLVDPDRDTDIGYPAMLERPDGSVLMVSYKRYSGLRRAVFGEPFITENPNFHNFFDGLEDGSINDWQIWRLSGYPSMAGRVTPGRASDHALFLNDASSSQSASAIRSLYAFEQTTGALSFWMRPDDVANGIEFSLLSGSDALSAGKRFRFRISQERTLDFLTYEGGPPQPQWVPMTPAGAISDGVWTKVEIGFRAADGEAEISVGGSSVGMAQASGPGGGITHLGFYAGTSPGTGAHLLVDDIYANRYVGPGPPATIGEEYFAFPADSPPVATSSPELPQPVVPSEFREVASKDGGEIYYQISMDGGENWSWWNGEAWALASDNVEKAATAAAMEGHVAELGAAERLSVRAFLVSNGAQAVSLDRIEIDVASTVAVLERAPERFTVGPAAPNPAFASAAFEVALPHPSGVRVEIFDVSGRAVREIRTPVFAAGRHRISWDCRNNDGAPVAAGIYFYAVETIAGGARGRVAVVR